jgi:hypothetical protein
VAGYYGWKSGDVNRWRALHLLSLQRCSEGHLEAMIAGQDRFVFASPNSMPRALKNVDISLGLAVIPVQLFTATAGMSSRYA